MSIVTEALNRLQAERARLSPSSEDSDGPQRPGPSESPPPNVFAPQPAAHTIRNILRVSLIIVALASVGFGAYLWGLTLMPDVARVSPEHDTGPEPIPELNPVEPAPTQVAEATPEPKPEGESTEVVPAPAEDSKGQADSKKVTSSTVEEEQVPEADSSKLPSQAVASSEISPSDVQKTPAAPIATPKPKTPAKEKPQVAKLAPSEPPPSPPAVTPLAESPKPPQISTPRVPKNATTVEAKLVRANYLIKKRRYGQAVTILQPLFIKPPGTWEPWFWLGTAQLGLGQLKEAEKSFIEGLARDTSVPQLWVQRALVSQQQGKFGEALESLRQAELLAPELPEVQLNLAYSLEIQGTIPLAVEHYNKFLALTEGQPAYHPARRKVLERVIRLEEA